MFFTPTLLTAAAITSLASAFPVGDLDKRGFSFPMPSSKGKVTYNSPHTVSGTFDGELKTYGRGVTCRPQWEGGDKDAVFLLSNGATLKNAIIGADQNEGVHCLGSCTIANVWWTHVCEDALTIKGNGNAVVTGGGARNAVDKIVQHNGFGTVTINGFYAQTFGKLYRSCGNCKGNGGARSVVIKNVKASGGKALVGINSNYGDKATIDSSTCATNVKQMCQEYTGNNHGAKPPKTSAKPTSQCQYGKIAAC